MVFLNKQNFLANTKIADHQKTTTITKRSASVGAGRGSCSFCLHFGKNDGNYLLCVRNVLQ